MIKRNKNNVRFNEYLYGSVVNTELVELGQKQGLFQGGLLGIRDQWARAGAAQAKISGQAQVDAQWATVEAQALYSAQIKAGEHLGQFVATQQMLAKGFTPEQIAEELGLSATFQSMLERAVSNEKLYAKAKQDLQNPHALSKNRFSGALMERMMKTSGMPSYMTTIPTGFEEGFYLRIPEAEERFEDGDVFGGPLPAIDFVSYERDEKGNYIFIQEDGSRRVLASKDVMRKVRVPGGEDGFKILGPSWDGPDNPTPEQIADTDNWDYDNPALGDNVNEYYVQADEAHELKFHKDNMNSHALPIYEGLTSALKFDKEQAYLISNSFAEKGFMGGLIDTIFVLLSKNKVKHKNFKDKESWMKSVDGTPEMEDVITLIESLPPKVKSELQEVVQIQEKVVNGKKKKVLELKVEGSSENIELTEKQATDYMDAVLSGDDEKAKKLASEYIARAENTPINAIFDMIEYDTDTDKLVLTVNDKGEQTVTIELDEILKYREAMENAGMSEDDIIKMAGFNPDLDPRRYSAVKNTLGKLMTMDISAITEDNPIEFNVDKEYYYDDGKKYQWSPKENFEVLAQSLELAAQRQRGG